MPDPSQVEYDDRPNAVSLKKQAPWKTNTGKANVRDDSEDDGDIHAIQFKMEKLAKEKISFIDFV